MECCSWKFLERLINCSRSFTSRLQQLPSMTLATSFGCDSITTWLEGSVVMVALICLAMLTSFSGVIM